MTPTLELTQEQARWFAELTIEWAVANVGSLLVIEIGVEHAIGRVVSTANIEAAIDVIHARLSDSALDSTLITILGVLGVKALSEQISKEDAAFDLETSNRVCDVYAAEHSIDIDGASFAMLIRLMHVLQHPDLPDILSHSDRLITGITQDIKQKLVSGESIIPPLPEVFSTSKTEENTALQYLELRKLERSTVSTSHFIALALQQIDEKSMEQVVIEMKNILVARHPAALKILYESDAQGG